MNGQRMEVLWVIEGVSEGPATRKRPQRGGGGRMSNDMAFALAYNNV